MLSNKIITEYGEGLSYEEKLRLLFEDQKKLLDTFLEKKAITQKQYDKSLGDLKTKMGFND